jgi:hypothetical protein
MEEIVLTAKDLFDLIHEKKVQIQGVKIKSSSSYLGIISMIADKMTERLTHERSNS